MSEGYWQKVKPTILVTSFSVKFLEYSVLNKHDFIVERFAPYVVVE